MFIISRRELQDILIQLHQSIYNHQQWYNDIIRTLVSRGPCDKHDLLPNAYRECRFGQWYYDDTHKALHDQQGFITLDDSHKRVHELATKLLLELDTKKAVSNLDYERFASSSELFRLELSALKCELETLLYNRDPLTSAINRVNMLEMLREQHELVRRNVLSCVLVMVDIDLFKSVNDTYGHQAGDQVLTTVSKYIIDNLRPYDKVFRYGGDEFLICFQQLDLKHGYELIERLREGIANMEINLPTKNKMHVTVSCGIALLDASVPMEQSIARADKKAYIAKSEGRNCTRIWSGEE